MYALGILGAIVVVFLVVMGIISVINNTHYETKEEFERRVKEEVNKRLSEEKTKK